MDSDEAVALAGLAMAEPGTTSSVNLLDFGDSSMGEAAIPEAKAPVATELKQEESQSQGIVDDDFDVDALVAGLVNTKIGGRRRKTRRRGGKKSRSKSRRH